MLNNLFGVVLRFREKEVGVVGDISKMYHRIAIPLSDQHVHRFLLRNMETDRETDVYVKTVLTFGDRPSPAMATVAMHKTAELKEDSKPKAAEAIKENTYMDDVCDSQASVADAKELISNKTYIRMSSFSHFQLNTQTTTDINSTGLKRDA